MRKKNKKNCCHGYQTHFGKRTRCIKQNMNKRKRSWRMGYIFMDNYLAQRFYFMNYMPETITIISAFKHQVDPRGI